MTDEKRDLIALLAGFDAAADTARLQQDRDDRMHSLFGGFLEVVDSLEALAAQCDSGPPIERKTVELILRQALAHLRAQQVEPIESLGRPVDLERHEIVGLRATDGSCVDVVLEDVRKGYLWGNRVLRRARVTCGRESDTAKSEHEKE